MKRKEKEEKRKTKINSGSTADRCTELKPVFDPSALKAQIKVIVDLSQSNMNLKVDSRKKSKVCR